MTSIDTQPRATSVFAIDTPLQPVQAPPAAGREIAVPASAQPSFFNRETATHAFLGLAQVGAIGGIAYLATSSVTLVAAALAGAVATGVAIAKAVSSRGTVSQLTAALDADRRALTATRDLLAQQTSAIASDRGRLDAELAHVTSERQHLAEERGNITQRVALEAHNLTEGARQALAAERAELAERVAAFEKARVSAKTPLEAEAQALTIEEIGAIRAAAISYCDGNAHLFAQRAYTGGQIIDPEKATGGEHALSTLVGTGKVVAGKSLRAGGEWLVPSGGATTITSVQQLRTFLRVATGLQT